MNYYELRDFKSIEIDDLIKSFNNNETIKSGCISVFEDSLGKPGDRVVELRNIIKGEDSLIFEFVNKETLVITKPIQIVINEKIIGVQDAEKIKWYTKGLELKYVKNESILETKTITGEHYFRINQNASAFLFFTW